VTTAAIIDEERLTAGVVVSCPVFGLSPSFSNRCANQTPNFCAEFRPASAQKLITLHKNYERFPAALLL
jgi:hypothetical protein